MDHLKTLWTSSRLSQNALYVEIQFAHYVFPLLTPILVTTKNFRLQLWPSVPNFMGKYRLNIDYFPVTGFILKYNDIFPWLLLKYTDFALTFDLKYRHFFQTFKIRGFFPDALFLQCGLGIIHDSINWLGCLWMSRFPERK